MSMLKHRGGHLPFLMPHSLVAPELGCGAPLPPWAAALQTALPSRLLSCICPTRCVSSRWPTLLLLLFLHFLLLFIPNTCSGASALLQNGVRPAPSIAPSAPEGREMRVNFLCHRLVVHRKKFGKELPSRRELPLEVARMPCCRPGAARAAGPGHGFCSGHISRASLQPYSEPGLEAGARERCPTKLWFGPPMPRCLLQHGLALLCPQFLGLPPAAWQPLAVGSARWEKAWQVGPALLWLHVQPGGPTG